MSYFDHDMPSAEDRAYEDARDDFELARDQIRQAELGAHEAGNEVEAQRLKARADAMTYTGLCWREDWARAEERLSS